jgi:hypothetical protein
MNKFKNLLCCLAAFFLLNKCTAQAQGIDKKVQLSLSAGEHREDFHWSIAGNGNGANPNVLSELKWKNVSGRDYAACLQWNFWQKFSFFADYGRVTVNSGSVNDMDYNQDNRTNATYTGNFSDNKGYTASWSAGAGYVVFNNKMFSLVPFIGYERNTQALYLVDLTGQLPGLNSSYVANWTGLFVKVRSSLKIWHALKLAADAAYSQVNYRAQSNWNLINEFQHPVSYRHEANGFGLNTNVRLVYNIVNYVAIDIGYSYFDWETGDGNDLLYLRSNGVSRYGHEVMGGVILSL